MIAKPFCRERPPGDDVRGVAGWSAEQDVGFRLERAFGDPAKANVRVFNDLRCPVTHASGAVVPGDYFQIDHLVLHSHGAVIIESKSVHGEMHVDRLGQWQRRSGRYVDNISSPLTQAQQQADALRALLRSANPPLLGKFVGLQVGITSFPIVPMVSISANGRLTGVKREVEDQVMKVDAIVEAIRGDYLRHAKFAGFTGLLRERKKHGENLGIYNLKVEELARIQEFLLSRDTPRSQAAPVAVSALVQTEQRPAQVPVAEISALARVEAMAITEHKSGRTQSPGVVLEPLTCSKCRSINVEVMFARDYCLKCSECGKFSPLAYACQLCGKHATVRKRGSEFYRECDGAGGCGKSVVFWRSSR